MEITRTYKIGNRHEIAVTITLGKTQAYSTLQSTLNFILLHTFIEYLQYPSQSLPLLVQQLRANFTIILFFLMALSSPPAAILLCQVLITNEQQLTKFE